MDLTDVPSGASHLWYNGQKAGRNLNELQRAQNLRQKQLLRFVFSNLVTLGLSMLLIGAFARMGLADLFAMLLSTCVTLAVNFLFSRLWVFR